ncbi:hypothetical protein GCM10009555_018950 [Acrocarpospora macrocephala]|uniref:Preprotein translocase SecA n=1 Tax=Acrocarpospora macrocephala TaxID=150177 RepID=A0A5M3WEM5_9ACTN|nr:SEC-C domain-containing protein [Acrocarpospora macrocephala]GES07555.1 hypothetical protein Amac_011500 [Acrocarpospora macrocephala]
MKTESAGDKAERRAREVAAYLGIPDFVYGQPLVRKGAGWREVGDGMLIVGDRGAILQVKARDRRAGLRDSSEKAERVIRKYIDSAIRQGYGSKRTIQQYQKGKPLRATPVRALDFPEIRRPDFELELSVHCERWPIIVIVDHPKNPEFVVNLPRRVFCISLGDWEQLHGHIRSVSGILHYIDLVEESGIPTIVGREQARFFEICHIAKKAGGRSKTSHPWFSSAAYDDPLGIELYQELIAKVWSGLPRGPGLSPKDIRMILAFLDDVPTSIMATVGQWTLQKRREFKEAAISASGNIVIQDKLLVYLCGSEKHWRDQFQWTAELFYLTLVRMNEWAETRKTKVEALGIGVREVAHGVEYTHVYLDGVSHVPKGIREKIEWNYGVANHMFGHTRPFSPGRNDPCPCGSGRKFKRCHRR